MPLAALGLATAAWSGAVLAWWTERGPQTLTLTLVASGWCHVALLAACRTSPTGRRGQAAHVFVTGAAALTSLLPWLALMALYTSGAAGLQLNVAQRMGWMVVALGVLGLSAGALSRRRLGAAVTLWGLAAAAIDIGGTRLDTDGPVIRHCSGLARCRALEAASDIDAVRGHGAEATLIPRRRETQPRYVRAPALHTWQEDTSFVDWERCYY